MPGRSVCPWSKYNHECKLQCERPSDADDPQKERLYCWEEMLHEELGEREDSLTLNRCREIVHEICFRNAIIPPKVTDGRGLLSARGSPKRIALPRSYRERITTVHETCHVLTAYKDPESDPHGSVFLRFFIEYLPRYFEDLTCLSLSNWAKRFGLEVAPRFECIPPSYKTVSEVMKQFHVVKSFNLKHEDYERKSREIDASIRAAERELSKVVQKVQRSMWPKGFHPMLQEFLKKH